MENNNIDDNAPTAIKIKEEVNHPQHYNEYPIEVIDIMISVFGKEKVRDFCYINAFKYRMRAGNKGRIETDLAKEDWYLTKAKQLEYEIGINKLSNKKQL